MSMLFLRTLSQALQAFVPIASFLIWLRAEGSFLAATAVRRGLVASVPVTVLAAWYFQASSYRAQNELAYATSALLFALLCAWAVWRSTVPSIVMEPSDAASWLFGVATVLIVVRQTMEIGAVLATAVFQVRSREATFSIVRGASIGIAVSWLWARLCRLLPVSVIRAATRAFAAVFVGQLLIYCFHESAEARLLPFSDTLHTATEIYGPDGLYGVHFSDLLVLMPLCVALWAMVCPHVPKEPLRRWRLNVQHHLAATIVVLAGVVVTGMQRHDGDRPPTAATPAEISAVVRQPHVVFRSTSPGQNFGRLTVAPLSALNQRVSGGLACERVSFAGQRGLCLHTDRSLFNSYTAFVFDQSLNVGSSVKLQGIPSRTRIAASGAVGAITVFVIGDNYAAQFSTRTTIVDMSTADEIGELEQFTTWRDGARFHAIDFNFWGATFSRDGNTFYASLRTAGKTYLVRGELGLRKLSVMREGIECPSLSPDNRRLAYKRKVGPSPDSWRLHVLDLTTNVERMISTEERYIDDQVEWLDDSHLLYSIPRRTTAISDVWVASTNGTEPARVFLSEAESPIVSR